MNCIHKLFLKNIQFAAVFESKYQEWKYKLKLFFFWLHFIYFSLLYSIVRSAKISRSYIKLTNIILYIVIQGLIANKEILEI